MHSEHNESKLSYSTLGCVSVFEASSKNLPAKKTYLRHAYYETSLEILCTTKAVLYLQGAYWLTWHQVVRSSSWRRSLR